MTINTGGGFGAVKGHPIVKEMRDIYDGVIFDRDHLVPCPVFNVEPFKRRGVILEDDFYLVEDTVLYPLEFFHLARGSGWFHLTENTYSIHHCDGSWISRRDELHEARKRGRVFMEKYKEYFVP